MHPDEARPRLRRIGVRLAASALAAVVGLSAVSVTMPVATAVAATGTTVTDYGVSNSGADSTSAIQSLVNGGGKSLYFPAGTYRFAGVSVPANTTLTFASGAKILPGYSGGNFLNVSGNNVTINGGDFDGQNTIAIAVMGSGVSGLTVDGTKATNMTNGNVNLVSVSSSTVKNTSSTNSQYGIVLSTCSYVTVNGTSAYGMGRDGILAYSGSNHLTISNNYVERWALLSQDGRAAIHTYGSSDISVFGNTVKNGTYNAEGIRFRDTERFEAYNNTIDNTGGSGIAVVSIGDWATVNGLVGGNGTIRDNTITNAHLRGISAPYVTDSNTHTYTLKPIRIFNNYIANTTRNAALFPYDSGDAIICYPKGSVVANNVIDGATGSGIRTDGGNTLVTDNTIKNVGTGDIGARSGVLVQAGGTSVLRNVISGVQYGYGIYGQGSVYQTGNTITGAAYGATYLAAGAAGQYAGDAVAPSVWSDIATSYQVGQTYQISSSDANSGVAATFVKVDGGTAHAYYGSPVVLDAGTAGTHTITYWCEDLAGNLSATQSRTYTVGSVPTPDPTPVPTPDPIVVTVNTPSGLAGTAVETSGSSIVTLGWTDNASNEEGFVIERAYEHDGVTDAWVALDTLGAGSTQYVDRVALGTIYKYRVRAYVTDGTSRVYSAYSAAARVVMPGAAVVTPPTVAAPSGAAGSAVQSGDAAVATLTWTDNAGNETGYEIERAYEHDGVTDAWVKLDTLSAGAVKYEDRVGLGTVYKYRVRAFMGDGTSRVYSDYCPAVRVVMPAKPVLTVPAAPTNLSSTRLDRTRATLTWTDRATNETGYQVWRYNSGTWSLYANVPANTTSYTTPRMFAGVFMFRVRAVNDAGASAFTDQVLVDIR